MVLYPLVQCYLIFWSCGPDKWCRAHLWVRSAPAWPQSAPINQDWALCWLPMMGSGPAHQNWALAPCTAPAWSHVPRSDPIHWYQVLAPCTTSSCFHVPGLVMYHPTPALHPGIKPVHWDQTHAPYYTPASQDQAHVFRSCPVLPPPGPLCQDQVPCLPPHPV